MRIMVYIGIQNFNSNCLGILKKMRYFSNIIFGISCIDNTVTNPPLTLVQIKYCVILEDRFSPRHWQDYIDGSFCYHKYIKQLSSQPLIFGASSCVWLLPSPHLWVSSTGFLPSFPLFLALAYPDLPPNPYWQWNRHQEQGTKSGNLILFLSFRKELICLLLLFFIQELQSKVLKLKKCLLFLFLSVGMS